MIRVVYKFYNVQLRQVKVIAESPEDEEVPGTVQTTSRSDPFQAIPEFDEFNALEEPPPKRTRTAGAYLLSR